ncbi:YHS domain-containing protein [Desulfosarcina sp. OttesenSCG-928-A07]|nr:YHS domain-containing protein [Desulfosarcina sp. OttesenSCG-928-G17]MDL2328954.1 YHS domain-containing protein [Desulfosarcina sp. OttesenSCG-928-A07]
MIVIRLLFFLVIGYLFYRAVKLWISDGQKKIDPSRRRPEAPDASSDPSQIDDVMIKDPVCGTHFPRREGVSLEYGGQTYLFCSGQCRDRFLEEQKNRH